MLGEHNDKHKEVSTSSAISDETSACCRLKSISSSPTSSSSSSSSMLPSHSGGGDGLLIPKLPRVLVLGEICLVMALMMTTVAMTMAQSLVFRGAHKSQLQRRPDVSASYNSNLGNRGTGWSQKDFRSHDLVCEWLWQGWLAIAKLKPISLFIPVFWHCQMLS